jgi:hypothetical protein
MTIGESHSVGHGRPPFRKVVDLKHTIKLATLTMPFWAWGIGIVKISISCMLLRFSQSKFWRIVLYILVALNVVLIIFSGCVVVFQCLPYKANWDFTIQNKKCWSVKMTQICLYFASSLHIFTDVATSLIPLTFLRKIRKPTKDKVIIAFLMALGLIASALSLAKVLWGAKTGHWRDKSSVGIMTGLLSCLEVQTAIIAACIPTLRGAGRRLLKKLGIMNQTASDRMSRYGEGSSLSGGPKGQSKFINLGRVHPTPGNRPYSTTENTSQTHSTTENQSRMNFQNRTEFLSDSSSSQGRSENLSTTSSRETSTPGTRDEEIDSEANYQMDPKTGRIICTTEVRLHSSRTHLRDEWIQNDGKETQG